MQHGAGIIGCHSVLLIFMIGFLLITRKLWKEQNKRPCLCCRYQAVIMTLVLLLSFRQMVMSITAFVLMCIIVGIILLIRPLASLIAM